MTSSSPKEAKLRERGALPRLEAELTLVRRLADRDPQAWQEFLSTYGDVIYSSISYTLRRHNFRIPADEIDDAVQELLKRLLEDRARRLLTFRGKHGCSLASWLRAVCLNHALEMIRRRRASLSTDGLREGVLQELLQKSGLIRDCDPREEIDTQRMLTALRAAAGALPARERLVFGMYYLDERRRDEIASALGLEANHVDQILFRIRRTLRNSLVR